MESVETEMAELLVSIMAHAPKTLQFPQLKVIASLIKSPIHGN